MNNADLVTAEQQVSSRVNKAHVSEGKNKRVVPRVLLICSGTYTAEATMKRPTSELIADVCERRLP